MELVKWKCFTEMVRRTNEDFGRAIGGLSRKINSISNSMKNGNIWPKMTYGQKMDGPITSIRRTAGV